MVREQATGYHMVDSLARFIILTLLVACLCGLIGPIRCASTRGAGAERAEAVIEKVEAIESKAHEGKSIVNNSHATPEEKAKLNEIFDSLAQDSRDIKAPVKQLGKDVDVNKSIADENRADAKGYRVIVWTIRGLLALAAVLVFVFRGRIISWFTSKDAPGS